MDWKGAAAARAKPLFARFAPLLVLSLSAVLAGCAAVKPRSDVGLPRAEPDVSELAWQRIRFRIHRYGNEPPQWHIDALLAHRVAAPALQRERKSIVLWRFHRRAADDAAGHSFSFLTYASREVNDALCRALQEDSLVEEMKRAGHIDEVECEGFPADKERLVEATSDIRWSLSLQRTWPYYIMGVSEMWLRLIDERARQLADSSPSHTLEQTAAIYETINRTVTLAWRKEGEHAFLHHLGALFGYEEIEITEKKLQRF